MRPVYIAGPYRGDILGNVTRACRLANHAVHLGRTPYLPHALGFLGVHAPEQGADDRAIACCLAMVHHIAGVDGAELWVIARDDGSLSAGTQLEVDAWDGAEPTVRTWAEWERAIRDRVRWPQLGARTFGGGP